MPATYLTDFGLAKATATDSKYTRTGQVLGTPGYASPEQVRGELAGLTATADVWSLGCVLYELLAGRAPFDADTSAAIVGRVIADEPSALDVVRPDVPAGLAVVVRAALAKAAADRYPHAGALRDELDRVLRGQRPLARGGRRVWPAVAAGLLAIGVGGGVAIVRWPSASAPAAVPIADGGADAERLAARAEALHAAQPAEAARLLEDALGRAPDRHAWRVRLGVWRWSTGDVAAAQAAWARVPAAAPEATRARLYAGLAAMFAVVDRQRPGADARANLRAAAAGTGPDATLAAAAAEVLESGTPPASLRDDPRWEAAYVTAVAELHRSPPDQHRVEAALTRGLEGGIPFAWAHAARAESRSRLGHVEGALADCEAALRLAPGHPQWLVCRGRIHQKLGDAARALADYEAALALAPDDPEGREGRADLRLAAGDLDGAAADLAVALREAPDELRPRLLDADLRRARGDVAGARAIHDAILAVDPHCVEALMRRATLRAAEDDAVGACADLDVAVAANPEDPLIRRTRGLMRLALGELTGAEADFTVVVTRVREDAEAHLFRGMTRRRLGNAAGARADLETARRLAPPGWKHTKWADRLAKELDEG